MVTINQPRSHTQKSEQPHRLRHWAATELLRQGAPLHEIGQLLTHRGVLTTAIYAKVGRDRLRELARPWPTGGAA